MNYDRLWFPSWTNTFYSVTWQRLTKAGHKKCWDETKQKWINNQWKIKRMYRFIYLLHSTYIPDRGYCRTVYADLNSPLLVKTFSLYIQNNKPTNQIDHITTANLYYSYRSKRAQIYTTALIWRIIRCFCSKTEKLSSWIIKLKQ